MPKTHERQSTPRTQQGKQSGKREDAENLGHDKRDERDERGLAGAPQRESGQSSYDPRQSDAASHNWTVGSTGGSQASDVDDIDRGDFLEDDEEVGRVGSGRSEQSGGGGQSSGSGQGGQI